MNHIVVFDLADLRKLDRFIVDTPGDPRYRQRWCPSCQAYTYADHERPERCGGCVARVGDDPGYRWVGRDEE